MTLDIEKFITNSIKAHAKIHHLDVKVKTVKEVPQSVKSMIDEEYGEKYLLDADYVSFFWGEIGKDNIKSLFDVVDKALGTSANKLTETDFKKIRAMSGKNSDAEKSDEDNAGEDEVEEEKIDIEADDDQDDDSEVADAEEEDVEEEIDNAEDSEDIENTEEDDDKEELDEDENEETEEVVIKASPMPTSYFFLKITTK